MTIDFNSSQWDADMATRIQSKYAKKKVLNISSRLVAVCVLCVGIFVVAQGGSPELATRDEARINIDLLIDEQVAAVYESAFQDEDDLLIWNF